MTARIDGSILAVVHLVYNVVIMRLIRVTLAYFRSFRKPQTFYFGRRPGLYLLLGDNQTNKRLGGNAAGKSTLLDAISWCLYDKTLRGLRAGDIANWHGEGMPTVDVEIENDGRYIVSRTWNPNSLTVTHRDKTRTMTQAELEKWLGINHPTFSATVLLGQFNRLFLDLSPAEKLAAFAHTLGLDQWDRAADVAKKRATTVAQTIAEHDRRMARIGGKIAATLAERKELKKLATAWDRKLSGRLLDLKSQLKSAKRRRRLANAKWIETQQSADHIDATLESLSGEIRKFDKLHSDQSKIVNRLTGEHDTAVRRLANANKQLGLLETAKAQCPTCGQPINPEHLQRELKGTRAAIQSLKAAEIHAHEMLAMGKELLGKYAKRLSGMLDANQQLSASRTMAERICGGAKRDYDRARDKMSDLSRRIDEGTENPHRHQVIRLNRSLARLRSTRDRLAETRGTYDADLRTAEFWHREFKALRLWLIESSLRQLTIETNNSLINLGLRGWRIEYDVERVTKSGTLTRGFTAHVFAPHHKNPVKLEAWCGGEFQRLKLAAAIGTAAFHRARTGVDMGVEMWDEPTQHLSRSGVMDLMDHFADRARDENREIWIVDHRAPAAGSFVDTVTVRKRKDQSQIIGGRMHYGNATGFSRDSRSKWQRRLKRST